MYQITNLQVTK